MTKMNNLEMSFCIAAHACAGSSTLLWLCLRLRLRLRLRLCLFV